MDFVDFVVVERLVYGYFWRFRCRGFVGFYRGNSRHRLHRVGNGFHPWLGRVVGGVV